MKPLALTMGDPAGIGPDIALAAWCMREALDLSPFLFVGDPAVLRQRARQLGLDAPIAIADPASAQEVFRAALPVLPVAVEGIVTAGEPSSAGAHAVITAIEAAVDLTQAGQTGAVVTNPIAKSVLYEAGFRFPGHTEFLGVLAEKMTGGPCLPVMMLAGPLLRVVPVTIHIPLKDVPAALNETLVADTARIVANDLGRFFGIGRPRLAISGLNPHAGEGGALGREDDTIIRPAIERLVSEGYAVSGPLPADTMFHASARAGYDAALCMYHDQALIPAKALGFDESANVTLGLPFVRTSPDHGTAFALAGTGAARHDSLVAALTMAATMAANADAHAARTGTHQTS